VFCALRDNANDLDVDPCDELECVLRVGDCLCTHDLHVRTLGTRKLPQARDEPLVEILKFVAAAFSVVRAQKRDDAVELFNDGFKVGGRLGKRALDDLESNVLAKLLNYLRAINRKVRNFGKLCR
jgi:hypothetical protein